MQRAAKFKIVLVTAPDVKFARKLAKSALAQRLIACANLIPKVESHYWWRGKIEKRAEVFLIMKTPERRLSALEKFVLARHPYDTPEFITLPLSGGNRDYLNWLKESCVPGFKPTVRGDRKIILR